MFVNFLNVLIFFTFLFEDFSRSFLQCLNNSRWKRSQFYTVLLDHFLEDGAILDITPRKSPVHTFAAGSFHEESQIRRQSLPGLEVDNQIDECCRLLPTRCVVVFGDLMESEVYVIKRKRPLAGVNNTTFHSREDFAPRQKDHIDTQFCHHSTT